MPVVPPPATSTPLATCPPRGARYRGGGLAASPERAVHPGELGLWAMTIDFPGASVALTTRDQGREETHGHKRHLRLDRVPDLVGTLVITFVAIVVLTIAILT